MNIKQFSALFLCSLATWFVGVSIMPLLPIYAKALGATPIMTGNYLAISFVSVTLGTMSAGRLVRLFQRRRGLIVAAGLICLPATWLMGRVTTIWQLTALTVLIWFVAGVAITLESIIAGLYAQESQRGRMFGFLTATASLAGLIGGVIVGPLVDNWGYEGMFATLSMVWIIQVVSGLFLPDRPVEKAVLGSITYPDKPPLDSALIVLFAASLLASIAVAVSLLGRSLTMNNLGYPLTAITLVAAAHSGLGLIANPLFGNLSDRVDRHTLLLVAFAANALGLLALATATAMPDFLLIILLLTVSTTKDTLIPAFVTDHVPAGRLDGAMSMIGASRWMGNVIGFAAAGFAIHYVGITWALVTAATLPCVSILLIAYGRNHRPRQKVQSGALGYAS